MVVENSPDRSTRPLSAAWVPVNTTFTAATAGVTEVLRFLIIQHFPLLVHRLPALKDPVNRRPFVDYKAWACRVRGGWGRKQGYISVRTKRYRLSQNYMQKRWLWKTCLWVFLTDVWLETCVNEKKKKKEKGNRGRKQKTYSWDRNVISFLCT